MHDYNLLKRNTPVVFAHRKSSDVAVANICSDLPDIYYKSFDINEFIGEQLALIKGGKK